MRRLKDMNGTELNATFVCLEDYMYGWSLLTAAVEMSAMIIMGRQRWVKMNSNVIGLIATGVKFVPLWCMSVAHIAVQIEQTKRVRQLNKSTGFGHDIDNSE